MQSTKDGKNRIVGAPAFFAQMASEGEASEGTNWSNEDLEREVGSFFDELVIRKRLYRPIAGSFDGARFWLRIGEALWDPTVRSRLAGLYLDETIRRILIMLSGAWMELRPEGWVKVAGTSFRLQGPSKRWAWQQVLEWEAGGINRNILKYLTAYRTDYAFGDLLRKMMSNKAEPHKETNINVKRAVKESMLLLEEAALNWDCDPSGSFRVDIPDRTPLKRWEVSSLRVWILPRIGLWIALERDEKPGVSFQWMVKSPHLRRWVIQDNAIPDIHLTMSALWRDLKIGGREVILPVDEKAVVKGQSDIKKIKLQGRIRWGSEEELQRILRKAYDVEPHIRVLPQGMCASHSAYRRARARGIRLKPGTTLVRGHQRGIPDKDIDKVPIKAQGLARLILSSRGFSTMT
jgi:hypothetical protein